MALFESDVPIVLIPFEGIPQSGTWQTVREKLGIVQDVEFDIQYSSIMPDSVTLDGSTYRFSGYDIEGGRRTVMLRTEQVSSRVLISHTHQNKEIALMVQNNNHYMINSNAVHLEMSCYLANLLKPASITKPFNSPSLTYVSLGEITSVLAAEDTEISINIPTDKTMVKLIVYNNNGEEVFRDGNYMLSTPLTYNLSKWSLLVVDTTQ